MDTNPAESDPELRQVTGAIVDAAYHVHQTFGPGLLERPYQLFLAEAIRERGHRVDIEVPLALSYGALHVEGALRLDMVVDDKVIVEVKALRQLDPVHFAQLLTYLRLAQKDVGLLVNFHVPRIRDGIHRFIRKLD